MGLATVALGSNIEPRQEYLRAALSALTKLPRTKLLRSSAVIETSGVEVPAEFAALKFLNQVVLFETELTAFEFSKAMHTIEDELGRVRLVRNGPRTIDIDLIDFNGLAINTPELTLPHPRAAARPFVMEPLSTIAPEIAARLKGTDVL